MFVDCDLNQPGASYLLNALNGMMEQGRAVENCEPLILGVNKRVFVGCRMWATHECSLQGKGAP